VWRRWNVLWRPICIWWLVDTSFIAPMRDGQTWRGHLFIFLALWFFKEFVNLLVAEVTGLQVLLSLCLVYRSWNNTGSILLFYSNLCKQLVFRRFVNITIWVQVFQHMHKFAYDLRLWSIGAFDGE
jgi:hypothetical protein